jgi:hypothetical protein
MSGSEANASLEHKARRNSGSYQVKPSRSSSNRRSMDLS